MRHSGILIVTLMAPAFVGGVVCGVWADEANTHRADQLKAAYLLNFVKFVEWPPSAPTDILTVCVVGGNGVHDALASGIENKRVGARRLTARRLQDAGAATGCNVLYLDAKVAPESPRTFEPSILTVSDAKDFARNGGMIGIFTDNNRLRFNINVDNAQKAGLRISSNLLQLAATVEKAGTK